MILAALNPGQTAVVVIAAYMVALHTDKIYAAN
jgi:hypothetical protein